MSNTSAKGTEVGGKTPMTTYVVSPDASKNGSASITYSDWLKQRRRMISAGKPGTMSILGAAR